MRRVTAYRIMVSAMVYLSQPDRIDPDAILLIGDGNHHLIVDEPSTKELNSDDIREAWDDARDKWDIPRDGSRYLWALRRHLSA